MFYFLPVWCQFKKPLKNPESWSFCYVFSKSFIVWGLIFRFAVHFEFFHIWFYAYLLDVNIQHPRAIDLKDFLPTLNPFGTISKNHLTIWEGWFLYVSFYCICVCIWLHTGTILLVEMKYVSSIFVFLIKHCLDIWVKCKY